PTGQPFEYGAHFISADNVFILINTHRVAALGAMFQQAFIAQVGKRRAYRCARYAKLFRQRNFFKTLAGLQDALQDPAAERVGDVVSQGVHCFHVYIKRKDSYSSIRKIPETRESTNKLSPFMYAQWHLFEGFTPKNRQF